MMMFDSQNTTQQNKKTFVFENEVTSQSCIVYHKINTQDRFTDLKPILDQYCPIQKNKIQLFNTYLSRFTPLEKINPDSPTVVPSEYLQYGFIMIRYKTIKSQYDYEGSLEESNEESSEQSSNKKDRSKERTIGQVIELVKRWRKLHTSNQGKKLNLQEAAKIVGISKKSLDDYYYQLRIGQQYDYDFQEHLNQKIGDLRAFVKSKKPQKIQKHRNSKHPKRLRIIEEHLMDEEPDSEENDKKEQNNFVPSQSPLLRSIQNQNEQFFGESASFQLGKDLEVIANNYYGNFEDFLDHDNDPYFYTGDFKKKFRYPVLKNGKFIKSHEKLFFLVRKQQQKHAIFVSKTMRQNDILNSFQILNKTFQFNKAFGRNYIGSKFTHNQITYKMLSQIKVNCKKLYLIGLGFQFHYEYLQRNHQNYKDQHSFWVYDKARLDFAYFLSKNKYDDGKMSKSTCLNFQGQKVQSLQLKNERQGSEADQQRKIYNRITYITRQNYETIQIRPRSSILKLNQTDQISKILKNNQFYIINSYRDAHPYQLYNKLCGYMNIKKCDQIRQLFRLSFSNHELSLRGSFLPEMQKIRSYYLDTSGLKLRVLDRVRNPSEEDILKNVEKWKEFYQIQKVMNSNLHITSKEEQSQKLSWIEQHQFGFQIQKKDIFQGYGRKFKSFLAI